MALRTRNLVVPLLAVVAAAIAILLLAPPVTGTAAANACKRWGDENPGHLSHPRARDAILCLINRERESRGRSRLHRDARLQKAAQRHSEYMRSHGCFDHDCPGERTALGRLQSVDYIHGGLRRWAYGENIAWGLKGLGTPREIVDAWMHSTYHRANILSRTFRDAGVGFVEGTPYRAQAHGGIYTVDFGVRVP